MIKIKKESIGKNWFEQQFGNDCYITVGDMRNDIYMVLSADNTYVMLHSGDWYQDTVKQMKFKGHYVYMTYVTSDDEPRFVHHCKLYFKNEEVVEFLRRNIKRIFSIAGNEYDIKMRRDKCTFDFEEKTYKDLDVYGVIDPVCGNFLSEVESEAREHMGPDCKFAEVSIAYEGDLKDMVPVCSDGEFNYYEVICEKDENPFYEHCRNIHMVGRFASELIGCTASPSRKRFLLKMRKDRPETYYVCLNVGVDETRRYNRIKANRDYIYLPETGETISYLDYAHRVSLGLCRETISYLADSLGRSKEDKVTRIHRDYYVCKGRIECPVEMERISSGKNRGAYLLKVGSSERVVSCADAADNYKDAASWLDFQMRMDKVKEQLGIR